MGEAGSELKDRAHHRRGTDKHDGVELFSGPTWRQRNTITASKIPFHWNRAVMPPPSEKAFRLSRAMEHTSARAAAIRAVEAGRMP